MNATQLKYAKERAQQLYNTKSRQINEKYTVTPLTTEEALAALEAGEFTLKEPSGYYKNSWYNYVSFNKAPTPDKKAQDKEQNELKEQYTRLLDELVLGDNQQALELLKAFESNG